MTNTWRHALMLGAALAWIAQHPTSAAGFAVHGQSTSQLGNAFAGVAASALDASTVWWNPAGMSAVPGGQAVQVLNVIRTSTEFSNENSSPAFGQPLGSEGGDAGTLRLTGALYTKFALPGNWHVGLAVNSPFGLRTVYDGDWMGRFQALKSQSQAYNINPAVAFQATKELSIGGGMSFQHFEAKLTNAVNYTGAVIPAALAAGAITPAQVPALLAPSNPANIAGLQGTAELSGDDWGYGWNLGFLYKPSDTFRVGAHYRSRIRYTLTGDVVFAAPSTSSALAAPFIAALGRPGAPLASGPVSADITLPDSLSMSAVVSHGNLDFLFDATWFGWSSLSEVVFARDDGRVLNRLNFQWRDTWRLAFGATYRYSERLHFRAGYAWDQTVIDDERTRSPRLPDATRHWFSAGSHHVFNKKWSLDLAGNFTKANDARIPMRADPTAAASGVLDGRYRANSASLSAQVNYNF